MIFPDNTQQLIPQAGDRFGASTKKCGSRPRAITLYMALFCILQFSTLARAQDAAPPDIAVSSSAEMQAQAAAAPASNGAAGESDPSALAQKLSNPISSLISVPYQSNFDSQLGPNKDGFRYTLNFQPVIPVALNPNWNLISRTIVPVISQNNVAGNRSQSGLGDTVQSFFFSPNQSQPFIWGLGPVLLVPTATDDALGAKKFGLGPTLVVLKQKMGWTAGVLLNHIWSVAGDSTRPAVNSTFMQPFVSYTTKTAWTITMNTETTYDWTAEQASVPVNFTVSKLLRFGTQPVSFGGGPKCWATSPAGAPKGCGVRVVVTPLFPRK